MAEVVSIAGLKTLSSIYRNLASNKLLAKFANPVIFQVKQTIRFLSFPAADTKYINS